MSRAFALVAALAAFAPTQAFACGMYIRVEDEKMLAQVFEEIDAAAPVVAEVAPVVEAATPVKNAANAAAIAAPASQPVIAEVAAETPES